MGSSSKTTSETKPPAYAAPLFTKSAEDALSLYNSGVGGRTYEGPTVAPLSGTTMQGVNQLANAGANWDTGQTRGLFGGIGAQAAGLGETGKSLFNPIATGQQGITTGNQWQSLLNKAGGKSSSETNLADMASGKYLQEGNPYFNARLENQLEDTAAQTRSLMSGSGRYGSDVSNRVLADRLGGIRSEALGQDWDRNLAAMMGANSQIDAARNAGFGNQATALSGLTGTQNQNIQNRLNASTGLINSQTAGIDRSMDAAGAMAGLDQRNFQNRLDGANATLKAGGILDDQAQALTQDNMNKWYAKDNEPWTRLSMLQGAASGAAGNYGSQLSTSRSSNPMAALGAMGSIMKGGK